MKWFDKWNKKTAYNKRFVKPERKLLAVISIRFFVIFVVDEK